MPTFVVVSARTKQGNVRLRLGISIKANRVLDADDCSLPQMTTQKSVKTVNTSRMTAPNRTHLYNLAFNQFDAIILCQNTGFAHAVVFVNTEASLGNLNRHTSSLHLHCILTRTA